MAYYFVAQIKISDSAEYEKYIKDADNVFSKYKGEYIAVDDNPLVVEGEWNYTRCVIIQFETKNDFKEWYYSDDYQQLLKYRLNAAACDTILANGDSK